MKKWFCLLLTGILLLSFTACKYEPAASNDQNGETTYSDDNKADSAIAIYNDFLSGKTNATDKSGTVISIEKYKNSDSESTVSQYAFYDMNGDDVPELILRSQRDLTVFWLQFNAVSVWYDDLPYADPLNNGAILSVSPGGAPPHTFYRYVVLDHYGNVTNVTRFEETPAFEADGVAYSDLYQVNGVEVTKEAYDETKSRIMSIGDDKILWHDLKMEPDAAQETEKPTDDQTAKLALTEVLDNTGVFTVKNPDTGNTTKETLENYQLYNNRFVPKQYTFVDLNADGIEELVIFDIHQNNYLVLRYNGERVYGYVLGSRSLINLKTDGTFMTSSGAAINSISRISFVGTSYQITDLAFENDFDKEYLLDGEATEQETVQKYFSDWETNTTRVTWETIE